MSTSTNWTVLGMYEDNGIIYAHTVQAASAQDAMSAAAAEAVAEGNGDVLVIVGAVPGRNLIFTPGEDNYKAAYAVDLAELAEERGAL